ncbi:hypothetical protein TNCV_4512021 [Trichonephila clavipes]|nr:hypothetical protein TNCV_4512021 [Trichonephila clavipes]
MVPNVVGYLNHLKFYDYRRYKKLPVRNGCPPQTNHREDHDIVRNARVQPTAPTAAIQVATALGDPVYSLTIRRCLAEEHLGAHYVRYPSRPPCWTLLISSCRFICVNC